MGRVRAARAGGRGRRHVRDRAQALPSERGTVLQPHSVPLQQLADGGVVALGLFVVVILAGLAVCVCALRRLARSRARRGRRARRRPDRVRRARARRLQLGLPRGDGADDGRAGRSRGRRVASRSAARRRPILGIGMVVLAARRARLVLVPATRRPRRAALDARARRRRPRPRARRGALGAPSSTRCRSTRSSRWPASPSVSASACAPSASTSAAVELQPDNPLTWYTLGIFEFEVREEPLRRVPLPQQRVHARSRREPVGEGRPARRRPRRGQRRRLRARL